VQENEEEAEDDEDEWGTFLQVGLMKTWTMMIYCFERCR
jgi:hypothetical protein